MVLQAASPRTGPRGGGHMEMHMQMHMEMHMAATVFIPSPGLLTIGCYLARSHLHHL